MSLEQLLIIAGSAIVLALAGYTAYLFYLLNRQKKARALAEKDAEEKREKRREFARESVKILLEDLHQGHEQLCTTEAAIRITALCQILPLTAEELRHQKAFAELANATAHIPILDKWKDLPRKEKHALDQERLALEKTHQEAIDTAVPAWLAILRQSSTS
ncbi:Uncharacterised protein [BD1-7 clade bacterium]|uniref:DUF2489 domain-containing protein n=1 Tax=BD1-7 clade bacterium TaxID=2029982 RepID=A0A5S9N4H6_9GAMM|nr:Uncharacterised protein [BD1-7 clade bacterium]CAA0083636.1 Uncharacterised protein [BD1-7 clade bacterium]